VDGQVIHVATENIPWLPQQIMMNIWISKNKQWAGVFTLDVLPVSAEYDYVRYYQKNY
jgi:beta-glucanase (GH16 family)